VTREPTSLLELADCLDLSRDVVASRLQVLGLDPADRDSLRAALPEVMSGSSAFLDGFYDRLLRCAPTRALLTSPELVGRLKVQQTTYLAELFGADYDFDHALRCLQIGVIHHRIRLTPQWFVASYVHFLCDHIRVLWTTASTKEEGLARFVTLLKSALFDAALVLDGYAMSSESASRAQRVSAVPYGGPTPPSPATQTASVGEPAVSRMRVALDEAEERAVFLGLDERVIAALHRLGPAALGAIPGVLDAFYEMLSSWDETKSLVPPAVVDRLKLQVGSYWRELFSSRFDRPYAASRSLVGVVHERLGISAPVYLIGLARQLEHLIGKVVAASDTPHAALDALIRAVFFDVSFVLQAYVDARAQAVLRSDGFASELLAGLTAGVAIVDARMRVDAVNPALLSLFGLEAGFVRHVPLSEVLPIRAALQLVARAWERPQGRFTQVIDHGARYFRATALRLTPTGATEHVALVLDEITDLVRVQSEVGETQRSLSQVIEAVEALVWEADDATFTFTLVSRPALSLTGHRDVALLGRAHAFTSLIPEPQRTAFLARCRGLAVGSRIEIKHPLNKADGSVVWLRSEVARVRDVDGAELLRGVSIDITDSQLDEQRRLEAVGRLAGGIAHEYNNRLTVILSSLSLIDDVDDSNAELVTAARTAAERCAALTKQILSFAQRQILRPQPVDLNDLVGRATASLLTQVTGGVALELRFEPNLWRCSVDPKELEVALVNLISNARDSMPAGGRLTLETRNVPANDQSPEVGALDHVEVSVSDTGIGMNESVRLRAFEPFFSTKPDATGLGLSIVQGFVAQSGGRVSLTSESGAGTVVRMRFPRVAERAPEKISDSGGLPFVLAVDDEPALRFVLERLMKRYGFAVTTVGSIAEALDVLRSRRVDILVTDVVLGAGESGAVLAPEARKLQPDLPVIFISGFTRQELSLTTLGEGDWFIPKPFPTADLKAALQSALAVSARARRSG
jgi:PAS domain S-box-containing protein